MQKFEVFEEHYWQPLKFLGLTGKFWNINEHTIIYTWWVLLFILIICVLGRFTINKKENIFGFLVMSFIKSFNKLIKQTIGHFSFNYFAFVTSIFIFIFCSNIISLFPFIEEPTTDANTTLALGIISFLYVQFAAIRTKGIKEYIKEYFQPFFLLMPLNVIGELAKVISISFRLFGNIFGGSIISKLWLSAIGGSIIFEILGMLSAVNITIVMFFVLFEGFIQAFVFSMLTLTYLSIAVSHEEGQHMEASS